MANNATQFLNYAAEQVAARLPRGTVTTLSQIRDRLRLLSDSESGFDSISDSEADDEGFVRYDSHSP